MVALGTGWLLAFSTIPRSIMPDPDDSCASVAAGARIKNISEIDKSL
jgi:hypothetical protein